VSRDEHWPRCSACGCAFASVRQLELHLEWDAGCAGTDIQMATNLLGAAFETARASALTFDTFLSVAIVRVAAEVAERLTITGGTAVA
jgi:hypothetical protein